MKNSEIIQLTDNELIERAEEEKTILSKLKMNHAVSPLDNPHKISYSRRTLARIFTEIQKRNLDLLEVQIQIETVYLMVFNEARLDALEAAEKIRQEKQDIIFSLIQEMAIIQDASLLSLKMLQGLPLEKISDANIIYYRIHISLIKEIKDISELQKIINYANENLYSPIIEKMSFTDTNNAPQLLSGELTFEKAHFEELISSYHLYFSNEDRTDVTLIKKIPKTEDLKFTFTDTPLPEGMTHFLILTANEKEAQDGLSIEIDDLKE